MTIPRLTLACLAAAMLAAAAFPASAQGPRSDSSDNWGWGPGMMMGPGPMWGPSTRGQGRFSYMCDPRMAGFAAYQLDRIDRSLRPTDAQKKLLDDVKTASAKARDVMAAACPSAAPTSMPARLEFMQKRAEAMLEAIKIVRPAFDPFYASLSDEQKAKFDRAGPRQTWWHRFWRGS